MTKMVVIFMAGSIALSGAAFAATYKLDDKGKCHDDKGKLAKQELCSGRVEAAFVPNHTYKLDAQKKCRDEKGTFAKAELCKH